VFPSAIFLDENEYFVDLKDFNTILRVNRDHSNILEINSLQMMIQDIVQGTFDNNNLPTYISITKPTESDSRKRLVLRSPVAINIFDSAGLHTGPLENTTSDLRLTETQIPNSYYREIAGHKYLGLDGSDTYRIELQGEGLGTFTLEIDDVFNDNIIASNSFIDIPITASSTGALTITASSTTALVLDIDGDGITDITISPGGEIDATVSLEVLVEVIQTLDIHKGLKKELIRKIEEVIKEFGRGKIKKAIKKLNKVIEKLEKEIKHNLKSEEKEEYDEKYEEHKDKHDEHKNHDKKKYKEKISTEDAQKLINIITKIIDGMV
jgi:hypothetical protein